MEQLGLSLRYFQFLKGRDRILNVFHFPAVPSVMPYLADAQLMCMAEWDHLTLTNLVTFYIHRLLNFFLKMGLLVP